MGRQVVITDDITGEPGADERKFSVGADAYEIDLTDESWEEFVRALAPYVNHGVRVGRADVGNRKVRPIETPTRNSPDEVAKLRAWAADVGPIAGLRETGKIANDIWTAFRQNDVRLLNPGRIEPKLASRGRRGRSGPPPAEQPELGEEAS